MLGNGTGPRLQSRPRGTLRPALSTQVLSTRSQILPVEGETHTAEGHVYAFGCTEEKLRKLIFGLKQIGSPSDDKYDRTKGAGYVAACDGQYADALSRNIGVSLLLVETTGALGAAFMTILRILAKQARLFLAPLTSRSTARAARRPRPS